MNQQAAIIIAGGPLQPQLRLRITGRYTRAGDSIAPVLRLNRWTGNIVACGGMLQPDWEVHCPLVLPSKTP